MKLLSLVASALLCSASIEALSLDQTITSLSLRHASSPSSFLRERAPELHNALEKRKGGGGRGGGGSSSGGSGGGSRGSSGGSGAARNAQGSSNAGGLTSTGTGAARGFGGGKYYGGGAAVPYSAGRASPRNLLPFAIFPIAALAFFPGLWLYGAYAYHYNNDYTFLNRSAINETFQQGINQTLPVTCLCQEYQVCGCDDNDDPSYLDQLVGNGTYAALDKTLVNVADVNGTRQLFINGSLPNGTTAPGGTDDISAGNPSTVLQLSGWWVMVAISVYAACVL